MRIVFQTVANAKFDKTLVCRANSTEDLGDDSIFIALAIDLSAKRREMFWIGAFGPRAQPIQLVLQNCLLNRRNVRRGATECYVGLFQLSEDSSNHFLFRVDTLDA